MGGCLIPFILWRRAVLRILCPSCRFQFMQLTSVAEEEGVICPRCGTKFVPEEEEMVDPEDD